MTILITAGHNNDLQMEESSDLALSVTALLASQTGILAPMSSLPLPAKTLELAERYLLSMPGIHSSRANRAIYSRCRSLIQGKLLAGDLSDFENALSYRLWKSDVAAALVERMPPTSLPHISVWQWEYWSTEHLQGLCNTTQRGLFESYLARIKKWEVWRPPPGMDHSALAWRKPERYVAAALLLNDIDPDVWHARWSEMKRLGIRNSYGPFPCHISGIEQELSKRQVRNLLIVPTGLNISIPT